jgi:hypothetical protein
MPFIAWLKLRLAKKRDTHENPEIRTTKNNKNKVLELPCTYNILG